MQKHPLGEGKLESVQSTCTSNISVFLQTDAKVGSLGEKWLRGIPDRIVGEASAEAGEYEVPWIQPLLQEGKPEREKEAPIYWMVVDLLLFSQSYPTLL